MKWLLARFINMLSICHIHHMRPLFLLLLVLTVPTSVLAIDLNQLGEQSGLYFLCLILGLIACTSTLWVFFLRREILARRAAEAQFCQNQMELSKLHLAVEQSPDSICITDIAGNIEYVNPAFEEASGYNKTELIGRNPRLLASGQTPREVYTAMWQCLCAGDTWKGELVNRRKNGEIYVESEIISPVRQADGHISHYLAIKNDITAKKRLEEELAQHRQHLEEMVAEKTRELRELTQSLAEARDEAQASSRAKAAFLSNMSHEIRTPMNGIIGMLHLLRRDNPTPKQQSYLNKIEFSAKHLLTLINDILDLSKMEAGKMIFEQQPVDLLEIISEVESIGRELAAEKGIAISTEVALKPISLEGDATRITQALLNYVANAVKFVPYGAIVIRCHTLEETDEDVLLYFEVADNGPGIANNVVHRLFTAFEQADSSTTRVFGGTGLGLAITKQLAKRMGGDAGVISTLGKGSQFWFTVQLQKGRTEPSQDVKLINSATNFEAQLQSQHQGRQILLVDDEPMNLEITATILQGLGLVITRAQHGAEAVDLAKEQLFDLVLMDMQMPVMDGLEATRQLRQLPAYATTPILAFTANAFAEDKQRCLAAGMTDMVVKPIEPEVLFAKIYQYMPAKQ